MKTKKNIALLLTSCAALLAGCGSEGENGQYYKDIGRLEFDENNQVVFNDVEITVRTICNAVDANRVESLVSKFNRLETGITVNFTKDGQGSYYGTLTRMISQDLDTVPELCMFHNERIMSLQQSKLFQPMGRIFDMMNDPFDKTQFYENTLDNNYIGEELFGVPVDAHSEVILYRKDLLSKYSLAVPTSITELINAAKTIQAGERKTNSAFYGASIPKDAFGVTQYAFNSAIFQKGGTIIDGDEFPNWTTDPAVKKAAQQFHGFYYGANAIAKPNTSETQSDTDFVAGNTAFAFVYTWNMYNDLLSRYGNDYINNEEYGILNMSNLFAEDNSKSYADDQFAISHSFFIPRTIKDINKKAAACYFAKWYATEAAVSWSEAGHVPQVKAVIASEEYQQNKFSKAFTTKFGAPESFRNYPKTSYYNETSDTLNSMIIEILGDPNIDIDDTINQYNTLARNKILSAKE